MHPLSLVSMAGYFVGAIVNLYLNLSVVAYDVLLFFAFMKIQVRMICCCPSIELLL